MALTSSSVVNRPFARAVDSAESQGKSVRSGSLPSLVKTTGVLALALSQGAQASSVRGLQANRNLEQKANTTALADVYDYNKACKAGTFNTSVEGLNYEDCASQGLAAIDASRSSQKLKKLKDCYQITGYIAAASFSAGTVFSCIVPDYASDIFMTGGAIGTFALGTFSLCNWPHRLLKDELKDSRNAVEACCKELPKKTTKPET